MSEPRCHAPGCTGPGTTACALPTDDGRYRLVRCCPYHANEWAVAVSPENDRP